MDTGSFPGVKSGRGVTLTILPHLVPLVIKQGSHNFTPLMGRTARTETQCLYKDALYLTLLLLFMYYSLALQTDSSTNTGPSLFMSLQTSGIFTKLRYEYPVNTNNVTFVTINILPQSLIINRKHTRTYSEF
jgi:hypothetical protein